MAALSKLNGYTKLVVSAIIIFGVVVGWAVAATAMRKDIDTNKNNILLLRDDIKTIKQDVKILLRRK